MKRLGIILVLQAVLGLPAGKKPSAEHPDKQVEDGRLFAVYRLSLSVFIQDLGNNHTDPRILVHIGQNTGKSVLTEHDVRVHDAVVFGMQLLQHRVLPSAISDVFFRAPINGIRKAFDFFLKRCLPAFTLPAVVNHINGFRDSRVRILLQGFQRPEDILFVPIGNDADAQSLRPFLCPALRRHGLTGLPSHGERRGRS